jgi:hypothetical protein
MKRFNYYTLAIGAIVVFAIFAASAQSDALENDVKDNTKNANDKTMKTYLIRRDIPNAGKLTGDELKAISQTSCTVLKEMGPKIEWIQSYVTGDQIYCVYKAENEDLIREHAKKGGFPANSIMEVKNIISPATADKP